MIRRLLRLLGAATAGAGMIGVVRHRRDTVRVRRGELPPAAPAVAARPTDAAGAFAERFAGWVPSPPRSPTTRVLAQVWAAPLTLPGFALALLSGARPHWSAVHGCWVARGVGGPSGLVLRGLGAGANTVGLVVLCRHQRPSEALLAHEAVHARQAERLGPTLLPIYVWMAARYGYRDNPLERAARLGAQTRE